VAVKKSTGIISSCVLRGWEKLWNTHVSAISGPVF